MGFTMIYPNDDTDTDASDSDVSTPDTDTDASDASDTSTPKPDLDNGIPGIVCDGCRSYVGWEGRVIEGERWFNDLDEAEKPGSGQQPFSNIGPSSMGDDQPDAPYTIAVVCSKSCHAFLFALWDYTDDSGRPIPLPPLHQYVPDEAYDEYDLPYIPLRMYLSGLVKWAAAIREVDAEAEAKAPAEAPTPARPDPSPSPS